jgi:hypothetical protein
VLLTNVASRASGAVIGAAMRVAGREGFAEALAAAAPEAPGVEGTGDAQLRAPM